MIRTKKAIMIFLFSLALLNFSMQISQAQTSQETLNQYVADLQKNPNDNALRERIIKHVQTMSLAPVVPEEAKKYVNRGVAAGEGAKTENDYKDAILEFQKAVNIAPWLGAGYRGLAVMQDKAGQYSQALQNLKFYLLTNPSAADAEAANILRDKIEYRQEKVAKELAEKARVEQAKVARPAEKLRGTWTAEYHMVGGPAAPWKEIYKIEPETNDFNVILIDPGDSPYHGSFSLSRSNNVYFQLSVDGTNIKGGYLQRFLNDYGCNPAKDQPVTGQVQDDNTIALNYSVVQATPIQRSIAGPVIGCSEPYWNSLRVILRRLQ